MKKFEAVLLFSSEIQNTDLIKLNDYFKSQITKFNGSFVNEEDWGLRDLSYQIKNNKKAFYKFFQIEIEGSKIQIVRKYLTQNDHILRHLFVKVNNHQELPTKLNNENETNATINITTADWNRRLKKYLINL